MLFEFFRSPAPSSKTSSGTLHSSFVSEKDCEIKAFETYGKMYFDFISSSLVLCSRPAFPFPSLSALTPLRNIALHFFALIDETTSALASIALHEIAWVLLNSRESANTMNYHRPQQSSALLFLAAAAAVVSLLPQISAFSTPASTSPIYNTIQSSTSLLDPISGTPQTSIIPRENKRKSLVVLLPQLGEFDSAEYVEFLTAAQPSLEQNSIDLRIIGIGDTTTASNFMKFTNLSPQNLYIDPNGDLHKELELNCGPRFGIPDGVSDDVCKFFLRQLPGGIPEEEEQVRPVATAWLNYLGE
jgi:hypothetical protein